MLKGIPSVIPPDLMKAMMEMGHGDELVLADGNFPAASCGRRIVRADGLGTLKLLDALLRFFPLDTYEPSPVGLMSVVSGDPVIPSIWQRYENLLVKRTGADITIEYMDRFDFYERSKQAFVIVATSERAQYANIILKKGVIREHEGGDGE